MAQYVLFALIMFGSNWLGSLAAYGNSILALPLITWLLGDPQMCVATVLMVGLFQAIHLGIANRGQIDAGNLKRMLFWCALGVPVGMLTSAYLPQQGLLLAMGIVVLLSGAAALRANQAGVGPSWVQNGLLVLGGIIHGAFASGGAPVVMAARGILTTKESFRATMFGFWLSLNVCMITAYALTGRVPARAFPWFGLALPFVVLGNYAGERSAGRLDQAQFRKAIAAMLVLAGIVTISRNL